MGEKRLEQRGGDLVIHVESPQRCFSSGQVTAPATPATLDLENVQCYPLLASNVLAKAGDEASVVAFILAGRSIEDLAASGSTTANPPYTILSDFTGAVLNRDALPDNDFEGNAFNKANIAAAVTGATWKTEPTKTSTQTN